MCVIIGVFVFLTGLLTFCLIGAEYALMTTIVTSLAFGIVSQYWLLVKMIKMLRLPILVHVRYAYGLEDDETEDRGPCSDATAWEVDLDIDGLIVAVRAPRTWRMQTSALMTYLFWVMGAIACFLFGLINGLLCTVGIFLVIVVASMYCFWVRIIRLFRLPICFTFDMCTVWTMTFKIMENPQMQARGKST